MTGHSLRFDAAEKRLVRACADDHGGGDLIRATVNNRFDNEVIGAAEAIHCRRRPDASEPFYPFVLSRREQSLLPQSYRRRLANARRLTGRPGNGDLFAA